MTDKIEVSSVSQEFVIGERVGRNVCADVGHVVDETIIGERYGRKVHADVGHVVDETIIGERYGRKVVADIANVLLELIVKEPAVMVAHVVEEAIVDLPDDPLSPTHQVPQVFQVSVQWKTVADPSTVTSATAVAGTVSLTVGKRIVDMPLGDALTAQVGLQVSQRRAVTPGGEVVGPAFAPSVHALAVMSREKGYIPQSMVASAKVVTLVLAERDARPAEDVISPIDVSRALTLVTARVDRPMPQGGTWAVQVAHLAAQQRTMPTYYSPPAVGSLATMVVQAKSYDAPGTQAQVGQNVMVATLARETEIPNSPDYYNQAYQQVTLGRETEIPLSDLMITSSRQLAAVPRLVPPPENVAGVDVRSVTSETAKRRSTPSPLAVTSPVYAGHVHIKFIQGRTMPHPDDVDDPSLGRHVGHLSLMAVRRRDVDPMPDPYLGRRRAHGASEVVVLADNTFLPPPVDPTDLAHAKGLLGGQFVVLGDTTFPPLSWAVTPSIGEVVVIADLEGWIDPTDPQSEASALLIGEHVVLGDTSLPPGDMPQSNAALPLTAQQVVLEDAIWPDPTVPQSNDVVPTITSQVVLGDTSMPPADIPQSDSQVSAVDQVLVLADPDLTGKMEGSPVHTSGVVQFAVLTDPTMIGLPLRPAGPRPVITISIR